MAPARKRGAKGAKSKSELSLGDLVLAKVKGFPAWPAKISRPEDWERAPDPKKYFVQFFGTEEIAFVAPVDIQAFTSESKKKLIARCQGKTVKYFAQAVKEIGEAFEELQHNKSSAVRDDTDRASGGCEAPSNDGVEDDAMEVDPKDGTDGDETSKETETRSLNEHSSGLERCSQKGRVKDCFRSGTSMACETDGGFLKATSSKKNQISNNDAPALENVKLSPKQDNSLCLKDEVHDGSQGGDAICTGNPNVVTAAGSSDACKNEALGDAEGDSQNGDSSLKSPVSTKISDSGRRVTIANGHKTERHSSGPKRIARGTHEVRRSSGPLLSDSRNCLDSTKSEDVEDERPVRTSGGSSMKIVSPGLEPKTGSANKRKKPVKDKKDNEVAVEGQKEALQGSYREHGKSEFSSGKKVDRIRLARNDTDASHPAKRSKHEEANDLSKKSLQKTRIGDPCSLNGEKMKDKSEVKLSTPCSKTESSAPKVRKPSSHPDDIDAPPQNKRRRRASEVASDIISHSDSKLQKVSVVATKSDVLSSTKTNQPPMQLHSKRRAVRIFDEDDEEEPKTPVHGGSSFKVDTSSVSDRLKNTSVAKDGDGRNQLSLKEYTVKESGDVRADSPEECLTPACPSESVSPNPVRLLGKKLDNETDAHISHSPGKVDFEKALSEDTKRTPISPKASSPPDGNNKPVSGPLKGSRPSKLSGISHSPGKVDFEKASSEDTRRTPISPKASPPPDGNHKPVSGPLKGSSRPSKLSGAGTQKKTHTGSSKSSVVVSDGLNHSQNQAAVLRSKQSSLERSKSTPLPNVQDNVSSHATESTLVVNSSLSGERLEASTDDKVSSFVDSKMSDSAVSMKNLIAVARAKKKEAHSQSSSRGMAVYHLPFSSEVTGRSPGHVSAVQPLIYGSGSGLPTDIQEHSLASPSHGRRFSMNSRSEAEEFGEKRVSSEHRPGGSLSGGTEAAVARDAFEGMLETLSRTKESISRATRLAIECAKYGIANEVVELLIRKLEGEPNLHRKVDLFFLVDSITQCSRTQKGIAEASYIPTVQAALPRLIGAAAPSGSAARENRKQCLKVLRLWVERKVLPESVLRRYMDEIGASNDDSSAGFFHRRPSRAERAVDDPIREMEGMLVDEYGSNATFQLPGLLTSHVFEDDEEEDIPSTSCKDNAGGSLEPVNVTGEPETSTPSDRRHRILEDVDGELEMEDVSGHPKDERSLLADGTFAPEEIVAEASSSEEMVGSPPLPFDSPPPSPPLPSSPIPPPSPPPLPRSPSSPPPPPPSPLPRALPQLSAQPQASMVQQQLHTPQLLVASSPKSAYQQQGSQALPTSGITHHGGHIEVAVRKDVYPQQSPSFALGGIPSSSEGSGYSSSRQLDYGSQELFVNSQSSQTNQQFQAGNGSFSQRAFHPTPVPQTASTHYLYPNSAGQQQHPQNPYPRPYSLVNHSEGSRRYGTDEQWRISSGELNPDNQRALWMNGGRAPSSGPPLSQEGYFRPPLEMMAAANNVGFQPPAPKSLPAGAPMPGHGPSQTLPSVSDISAHSYWRPS